MDGGQTRPSKEFVSVHTETLTIDDGKVSMKAFIFIPTLRLNIF
jgi:hypothetical protein